MNQQQFSKSMVVNGRVNAPFLIPSWYKRKWYAQLDDDELKVYAVTEAKWPAKADCDHDKNNSIIHTEGRNGKTVAVYLSDAGAEQLFYAWRNSFATRRY